MISYQESHRKSCPQQPIFPHPTHQHPLSSKPGSCCSSSSVMPGTSPNNKGRKSLPNNLDLSHPNVLRMNPQEGMCATESGWNHFHRNSVRKCDLFSMIFVGPKQKLFKKTFVGVFFLKGCISARILGQWVDTLEKPDGFEIILVLPALTGRLQANEIH